VNNEHAFNFYKRPKKTCCISNGVDTEVFLSKRPVAERPQKCIFAGSSGKTKGKGFEEIFWPLEKILPDLGFETDFRPVDDINPEKVMDTSHTVDWYNSASYCLIASVSEGTPNLLTEAVACGCVAISVPVGNILEWGLNRTNCMIVERNVDSFVEALIEARNMRSTMSGIGQQTIRQGWSYGKPGYRAEYFFQLFRRLICHGEKKIQPFTYSEVEWKDI
jgi:glycosyltransferase involved in cell wall biosynthesis